MLWIRSSYRQTDRQKYNTNGFFWWDLLLQNCKWPADGVHTSQWCKKEAGSQILVLSSMSNHMYRSEWWKSWIMKVLNSYLAPAQEKLWAVGFHPQQGGHVLDSFWLYSALFLWSHWLTCTSDVAVFSMCCINWWACCPHGVLLHSVSVGFLSSSCFIGAIQPFLNLHKNVTEV